MTFLKFSEKSRFDLFFGHNNDFFGFHFSPVALIGAAGLILPSDQNKSPKVPGEQNRILRKIFLKEITDFVLN